MKKDLPEDVHYSYGFDNTKFIRASIDEVKQTVYEAFVLVIILSLIHISTATRGMLLSMAASAVSFFAVYYGFHTVLGNHALWLAFLVYLSPMHRSLT